jgi:hypothetical protein
LQLQLLRGNQRHMKGAPAVRSEPFLYGLDSADHLQPSSTLFKLADSLAPDAHWTQISDHERDGVRSIIQCLRSSMSHIEAVKEYPGWTTQNFWPEEGHFFDVLLRSGSPPNQKAIVEATNAYLDGTARGSYAEAIILRANIASEALGFFCHHFNEASRSLLPASDIRSQGSERPLTLWGAVLAGFLAFDVLATYWIENRAMTPDTALTLDNVLTGFTGLGLLISTAILLPRALVVRKRRARLNELLYAFKTAYLQIQPGQRHSPRKLRDALNDAEKVGVGWPPSLYAILDDMETRRTPNSE